jgi:hypothetical protein
MLFKRCTKILLEYFLTLITLWSIFYCFKIKFYPMSVKCWKHMTWPKRIKVTFPIKIELLKVGNWFVNQ